MTDPNSTDRLVTQGKALVRAGDAASPIEPGGPFERALAKGARILAEEIGTR